MSDRAHLLDLCWRRLTRLVDSYRGVDNGYQEPPIVSWESLEPDLQERELEYLHADLDTWLQAIRLLESAMYTVTELREDALSWWLVLDETGQEVERFITALVADERCALWIAEAAG